MKLSHIIAIVVIAVGISVIISTAGNASSYVSFEEAFKMAESGDDSKIHVIGELTKNKQGDVVGVMYNPQVDPNYMEFTLTDDKNKEHKVICVNPPASMQDFYKSEKVVVIGMAKGKDFVATEVLMKCPSKYEETELKG
jgi:cytochrome c-type biogenesis protein CcmE